MVSKKALGCSSSYSSTKHTLYISYYIILLWHNVSSIFQPKSTEAFLSDTALSSAVAFSVSRHCTGTASLIELQKNRQHTFIKTRSLVVRAKATLSSLLPQSWYQWWRTWVLSILRAYNKKSHVNCHGYFCF